MQPIPAIYHLDDDALFLAQVRDLLGDAVASFQTAGELWQALDAGPEPAVVILDIYLEGAEQDGRGLAKQLRCRLPQTMIVMCSDLHDTETVKSCIARGADDFLFKGQDERAMLERILAAEQEYKRRRRSEPSSALPRARLPDLSHIAGRTARELGERVPRLLASALSSIHVYGETGTGKEIVADIFAAHLGSNFPFVRIHCGTFPAGLIESELFGHVKGAFTGAQQAKTGLFEQADGGWVFLDEVATLTPAAQIALLRVLENQELRPVGASLPKKINVRVLSATNENLEELVEKGQFRRDLWQRLCEASIYLPPLHARKEELDELVPLFCKAMRGGPYTMPAATLQVLKQYDWRHGNIRELRNCLRAMTEHAYGGMMSPSAIPSYIWSQLDQASRREAQRDEPEAPLVAPSKKASSSSSPSSQLSLEWSPEAQIPFEKLTMQLLLKLIRLCFEKEGHMTLRQLGRLLAIPRSTLSTKLQELIKKDLISAAELRSMVNISGGQGEV